MNFNICFQFILEGKKKRNVLVDLEGLVPFFVALNHALEYLEV